MCYITGDIKPLLQDTNRKVRISKPWYKLALILEEDFNEEERKDKSLYDSNNDEDRYDTQDGLMCS